MKPNKTNGRTQEEIDRMCQDKRRWSDELSARAGAMIALERYPDTVRLYTYRCPVCSGYHLTRVKQRGQTPVTALDLAAAAAKPAANDHGKQSA